MSGNHRGGDGLSVYRDKRDAESTPEPIGGRPVPRYPDGAAGRPALFVVQKHAASRMHYDLRLEIDGVLESWAVPKGPSLDPADKRLAMQTEPHPLEYATFEGVIPAGQYGAGAMIVWDTGAFTPHGEPRAGLSAGKLDFDLEGYKLRGRFALIQIKGRAGASSGEWLLVKKQDRAARAGVRADPRAGADRGAGPGTDADADADADAGGGDAAGALDETSVLSGRSVEELAADETGRGRAQAAEERLRALGAARGEVALAGLEPMLCEPGSAPFSDPEWLYELKYDGYRLLAAVGASGAQAGAEPAAARVQLRYRSGKDATPLFPEITRALASLPLSSLVLDGEVVAFDDHGRPVFRPLQTRNQLGSEAEIRRSAAITPVTYMVFDLLACEGYDLRALPLSQRKQLLASLLPRRGPVRYADHIAAQGESFFEQVVAMGLEGVVAKRADSRYRGGRHPSWRKLRRQLRGDFVICGYTSPLGTRVGFGSLHLAAWAGRWRYVGRVGTGFDAHELSYISELLQALPRWEPDFAPESSPGRVDHWVEPRLVCEVRYQELSSLGHLRLPVFLHLCDDKLPRACTMPARRADAPPIAPAAPADEPASAEIGQAPEVAGAGVSVATEPEVAGAGVSVATEPDASAAVSPALPAEATRPGALATRSRVAISNPDKLYWPGDDGTAAYCKRDLIEYYRAVSPWLLPYLRDRPVALDRYPEGIGGHSFFQKDAPAWIPGWMRTEVLWSKHAQREVRYFICDSVDALAFLANMGTIPLHIWASRVADLARPDWTVLDLDPKQARFELVVKVAREIRTLCQDLDLPCFVKTSGATGLHVLIPLGGAYTYEQGRLLAQLVAKVIETEHSDIATTERRLRQRAGRVYLDCLQNGHGKLLVAPFSVRPLPGAPVSMPLRWREVTPKLDVGRFTIANASRRLRRMGEDPIAGVRDHTPDLQRALTRLGERLAAGPSSR
ncbi:MAG: DNA ligase D [Haliangiales bacterium]